jgi:Zn-dependent protease with chaperone function
MKKLFLLPLLLLFSTVSYAGFCDIAWDGNQLAKDSKGQALSHKMELLDNNTVNAVVTVAQIIVFYEAYEAISRQTNRYPSYIICDNKEPNAFAVREGNGEVIGITIGMLKLVNGDRDMAATVIGHEYAHLIKNHGPEGHSRDLFINILGKLAGQHIGVQGLGVNLGQIGATLISRKFSRDQEREADEHAFNYMVNAGFNPRGAIRLAKKLDKIGPGNSFFDTHPGWKERGSTFQAMIANSPPATHQIMTPAIISTSPNDEMKNFFNGLAAWNKNETSVAIREFRKSANAGYAPAQHSLGEMYKNGQGVTQDHEEAAQWYRMAAIQGYTIAQYNLGLMYQSGQGVKQDSKEAVIWLRKAAEQGDAGAQHSIGVMYAMGGGLAQDYIQAHMWIDLAISNGNKGASKDLRAAAKRMTPVQISKAQDMARECVKKSYKNCD